MLKCFYHQVEEDQIISDVAEERKGRVVQLSPDDKGFDFVVILGRNFSEAIYKVRRQSEDFYLFYGAVGED